MTTDHAKTLTLFQRINEVRKAVGYIQRDKNVSAGAGGNYMAVTHDAVTAMTRAALIEHGVVIYPSLVDSVMNLPVVNTDGTTAKQRLYEATYDFHVVNCDDSKDEVVIRMQAHALDNGDKAPGKCLSYAKKILVLKLLDLETGENDESRYQEAESFDLLGWSEKIDGAAEKPVVQYLYLEAKKEAMRLNDAPSLKTLGEHVKAVLAKKFPEAAK